METYMILVNTFFTLLFVNFSLEQCIFTDKCVSVIDKGRYYRGKVSLTNKAETCLNWDSHDYDVTPKQYPDEGLENNYCRNPLGSGNKPWCYTKLNHTSNDYWGYCDIPACDPCYFRGIQFKQEDAFHDGCSQCICLADGFHCYRCRDDPPPANGTDLACYIKENPRAKYPACCKRTVCHGRDADFNFEEFTKFLKQKLHI
ncbi:hepatocyte growth factor-like protein [Saccostrea cucullata]|uniref:hepatocyte growth factor-like protein n=1 Tax=Saccostrea cuccullata TaxID=36930 RepID=UPI002ECFBF52